jgi:hypothetical protein
MSQQYPNNPFTPPPPVSDSPFEPRTITEKTEYVNKNVFWALGLAIFSFLFCGFIGFYAFGLANNIIQTIDFYNVSQDKRGLAIVAKIIALIAAGFWVLGVLIYVLLRFQERV